MCLVSIHRRSNALAVSSCVVKFFLGGSNIGARYVAGRKASFRFNLVVKLLVSVDLFVSMCASVIGGKNLTHAAKKFFKSERGSVCEKEEARWI